jgi:hypothetical protein
LRYLRFHPCALQPLLPTASVFKNLFLLFC